MRKSKLIFTFILIFVLLVALCTVASAKTPPSGIQVVDETVSKKNDGELIGVSSEMEYRLSPDGKWQDISGNKVSGLSAGSYDVRFKATGTGEASEAISLTIKEGRKLTVDFYADGVRCYSYSVSYGDSLSEVPAVPHKVGADGIIPVWDTSDFSSITSDMTVNAVYTLNIYSVTLPLQADGYTLTPVNTSAFVKYGEDYSFSLVIKEGYTATPEFAVRANGVEIKPSADNLYTIPSISQNTVITVDGIKDVTAPKLDLTVGKYGWSHAEHGEVVFVYTNTGAEIKLKATDAGSGIDKQYIYISDFQLSLQELQTLYYWDEYKSGMTLPSNAAKFVYIKVLDKAGNASYVGTDGIIFDNQAPEINIEQGRTYYGKTAVEIKDANLDSVTVDGKLSSSSFILIPRDKAYQIEARDKAGNVIKLTANVQKAIPEYIIPMDLVAAVGQTLADVVIPAQENGKFVWSVPLSTSVGEIGKNTFKATFIPNDTTDYQIINDIAITISVSYHAHEVPSGINSQNETIKGKNDGALTGLKKGMEYRLSTDTKWTPVLTERVDGLGAGVYFVRYAATGTHQASAYIEVTIGSGRMLEVSFFVDGEKIASESVNYGSPLVNVPSIPSKVGYNHTAPYWDQADFSSITTDLEVNAVYIANTYTISFNYSDRFEIREDNCQSPVKYGEDYSFFIDIGKEYMQGIYFNVSNNGVSMQPDEEGRYTIEDVAEVHNIIVTGIVLSAKAEDIRVDGIYNKTYYAIGDKFVFTAIGVGMDNAEPSLGDERYVPVSWFVDYENDWSNPPYSGYFTLYKEGDCTLKISFRRELYDGEKWTVYGDEITKTYDIYVNKLPAGLPSGNSTLSTMISIILISAFTGAFIIWYLQKRKKTK